MQYPFTGMSPTTAKEQACVDYLKTQFNADHLDAADTGFLTDNAFLRFTRARDASHEKSATMLRNAIEWRKEYKPYAIKREDICEVMNERTISCGGRCKAGRPIILMTTSVPNKCNAATRIKQLVYILEQTSVKGYEKITWILDFGEMGKHPADSESKETRKSAMQILQDYYPERLGLMLLVRTPWYIRWLISFVKPFLEQSTREKMIKVDEKLSKLVQYIDADELPEHLGGHRSRSGLQAFEDLPVADPSYTAACQEPERYHLPTRLIRHRAPFPRHAQKT